MPFVSLALPAGVNRWVNIVSGAPCTVIMILAIRGGWHYYVLFGLIEITLTLLIVWYAWTWPKLPNPAAHVDRKFTELLRGSG
jgi:TRAP-type C4-dicarboxylate transport system permease small subunit